MERLENVEKYIPIISLFLVAVVPIFYQGELVKQGQGYVGPGLSVLLLLAAATTLLMNYLGYSEKAIKYRGYKQQVSGLAIE